MWLPYRHPHSTLPRCMMHAWWLNQDSLLSSVYWCVSELPWTVKCSKKETWFDTQTHWDFLKNILMMYYHTVQVCVGNLGKEKDRKEAERNGTLCLNLHLTSALFIYFIYLLKCIPRPIPKVQKQKRIRGAFLVHQRHFGRETRKFWTSKSEIKPQKHPQSLLTHLLIQKSLINLSGLSSTQSGIC